MKLIITSLLNDFVKMEEIENSSESEAFEHFCNYTIIANQCSDEFDFDDISTGGGNDTGIDGIGIIVNGELINNLIENEEAIDAILNRNRYLDVDFIFIQSKNSPRFKGGDIHTFYHSVEEFFKENPTLQRNDSIKEFFELKEKIFAKARKFTRGNPTIKVFYLTTGIKPDGDNNMKSIISTHEKKLLDTESFKSCKTYLLGAKEIINLYRNAISKNSAEFTFDERIELSPIDGVDEAHYGVLSFKEFKKILIDENGKLLNIFDDNIRDYQGDGNTVNDDIFNTLKSENPDLFSVLNNGVTVVANDVNYFKKKFTITDYQIVNGCQTSNVLFKNKDNDALDDVQIPLRLIITADNKVRNEIILSTNNQTPTKKVQHAAMSEFQKSLELYYNGCLKDARLKKYGLYYERRSKQYASADNVKKIRIITMDNQAKAYFSMFKRDAHLATAYFGKLADQMNQPDSGLCDDDHKYAPYYMAGLAYYKLEAFFRSKDIDKTFKKVRFYILMLVLMIVAGKYKPKLDMTSERKTENFCRPIIDKLLDDKICLKIFQKAVEIIVRSGEVIDSTGAPIDIKEKLKSASMTTQIINAFNEDTDRI